MCLRQTKVQRYARLRTGEEHSEQLLTAEDTDGNLNGYHKKKYVCKVGSALRTRGPGFNSCLSFCIYTSSDGTSTSGISKLSILYPQINIPKSKSDTSR